jgi:hypothetical protein
MVANEEVFVWCDRGLAGLASEANWSESTYLNQTISWRLAVIRELQNVNHIFAFLFQYILP